MQSCCHPLPHACTGTQPHRALLAALSTSHWRWSTMQLPLGRKLEGECEACCQATCSYPCKCTRARTHTPAGPRGTSGLLCAPGHISTDTRLKAEQAPARDRDEVGTQQFQARCPSLLGSSWPQAVPYTSPEGGGSLALMLHNKLTVG